MKPINLKIKGINSYVTEQVIDFAKLSESCLFGIFGETGSGKSTILDAIVIALYGSSDRDLNINLVNVNSDNSLIEFVFEMQEKNNMILYRVKRNFRVRASGLKVDGSLEDLTNGIMLADTVDATNSKLLKIIGIAKKEFLKCIALPQNEFDKFLMDTPSERKRSIAKLFNLEQFGVKLNEKIKNRRISCENKKLVLEEKLGVYKSFFILNEKELITKKNKITKDIKTCEDQLVLKENNFNTKQALYDNIVAFTDINNRLNSCNNNKNVIEELNKLVEFSENYQLYNEYCVKIKTLEKQINELKNGIDYVKQTNKNLEKTIIIDGGLLTKLDVKLNELNSGFINAIKLEQETKSLREKLNVLNQEKDNLINVNLNLSLRNKEINNLLVNYKLQVSNYIQQLEQEQEKANEIEKRINIENKREVYDITNDFKNFEEINYKNLTKINYTTLSKDDVNSYEKTLNIINNKINNLSKDVTQYEKLFKNKINNETENLNELHYFFRNINLKIKDISSCVSVNKLETEQLLQEEINNNTSLSKNKNSLSELETKIEQFQIQLNNIKFNPSKKVLEELEKAKKNKEELVEVIKLNEKNLNQNNATLQVQNIQLANVVKELTLLNTENKNKFTNFSNNNSKPLTAKEIEEARKKIEEFTNEQIYLTEELLRIKKVTGKQTIAENQVDLQKKELQDLKTKLQDLKNNLQDLKSELLVTETEINKTKTNNEKQQELKEELSVVNEELNVVQELALQVSNNSFMDFVSEEYLHLITDFSNKFIYKISQGKYFIEYDGNDFVVVDNFNGGNKRNVKTLSGGERFIMSLGLALGISQSIAANSNRSFNFFFIDEGFGNLSESYVNSVLACFDSLIKLDFTVGFISHVEKMQDFITNKIIVEKKSTEEGSVIHSYF